MRICILLRSFDRGGSERQAAITAAELRRRDHDVRVLVLRPANAYRSILDAAGLVPTVLSGRRTTLVAELRCWFRRNRPDVVLSYLAGPNLLSLTALGRRSRPRIVWGIRSSTLDLGDETRLGGLVYRIEPHLSRWCDLAVANSARGRSDALERGFTAPRIEVVPNGIDTGYWRPAPDRAPTCRARLGLPQDATVIGFVGRLYPTKGVPDMLAAVADAVRREPSPSVAVAVIGGGEGPYVEVLRTYAESLGIGGLVHWLGENEDLADAYPAFDLLVSPSHGEGFSNVLGEALSCGIPCIGTDVGETPRLIDDERFIVPAGDVPALSRAIGTMVSMDQAQRNEVGQAGRRRMVELYSVEDLGERLERILLEVVDAAGGC